MAIQGVVSPRMRNDRYLRRDGFEVCLTELSFPADPRYLDRQSKRDLAICLLFLDNKMKMRDIARIIGEDHGTVVKALIQQKVILDRRQKPRPTRRDVEQGQRQTA